MTTLESKFISNKVTKHYLDFLKLYTYAQFRFKIKIFGS